ncbi:MAG: ABC transporter substrate-binding protein, partial [Acidobacteriota bacterium]
MVLLLKRLSLGLLLIGGTSAILLLSDVERRTTDSSQVKVAILQYATSPLMDAGVKGMREALNDSFSKPETLTLQIYNAYGDMPTANAIASEITSGQFDLILTSSTPAMQAVANANRLGKTTHVFGLVADPFGAGVGINRENPLDHPAHLVGIGSFIPVRPAFELAREMFPNLKTVGEVWNPAESNSEAFTREARRITADLGIELLEATVDNSAGVFEAASSLVSRGVEAIWMGGDNTVASAADSVLAAARAGHIPVFSILTGNAEKGALFESGADFYEIGRQTGELAARILEGADPATIPVVNSVPAQLVINRTALSGLRDPWRPTREALDRAHSVIDESGIHTKSDPQVRAASDRAPLAKTWQLSMLAFTDSPTTEEVEKGVLDGLREAGLVESRDYVLRRLNAQGDMATANSLVDVVVTRNSDLLITISTPILQASVTRAGRRPIVFSLVANPILAGAGRSNEDHLPHVTGVFVVSPFDDMMSVVRQCLPEVKVIGSLYAPAEVNSVFYKDLLLEAAKQAGIEVELVGVNVTSEVSDAALSLSSRNIDALVQISDNMSSQTFVAIAEAANRFKLPVFTFNTTQAEQGAAVVVARDYYDGGRDSALLAARVMRGEDPATIPFQPIRTTRVIV